jgi:hypothetical protein
VKWKRQPAFAELVTTTAEAMAAEIRRKGLVELSTPQPCKSARLDVLH